MNARLTALILTFVLCLPLAACGGSKADIPAENALTWQEQYDLGIKFLSDGNYEEAIIAFTAAIEIDPKQVDAYLSLAEIHKSQGNVDQGITILQQALAAGCTDGALEIMLEELNETREHLAAEQWWAETQKNFPVPPMELTVVRSESYDGGIREYDANDRNIRWTHQFDGGNGRIATQQTSLYLNSDGTLAYRVSKCTWNDNNQCYSYSMTTYDGTELERILQELSYSPTYVTTKAYSYSGSQVGVTFTYQNYNADEPNTWQQTYVMKDPNHMTRVSGMSAGNNNQVESVTIREIRITISPDGFRGSSDLMDTKYDSAGNVVEVKEYSN